MSLRLPLCALVVLLALVVALPATSKRKRVVAPKTKSPLAGYIETRVQTLRLISAGQTQQAIELWERFVHENPRHVEGPPAAGQDPRRVRLRGTGAG